MAASGTAMRAGGGARTRGAAMGESMSPSVVGDELLQQFPTYLMQRRFEGVEEMNERLVALLLEMERAGLHRVGGTTNVGGFHTEPTLFGRAEPEVIALRELVAGAVRDYADRWLARECSRAPETVKLRVWGWGIIMRAGDANTQHVHPDAKISGVYYAHSPEGTRGTSTDNPAGAIMFCDPRPRANMNRVPNQITEYVFDPEPGTLFVFPAYYEHAVLPFRGDGMRVSIAFNGDF